MAVDYDELRDLWYAWLFSRLHYFLALEVSKLWQHTGQKVLDVGCGTGFQSFLYGALGCEVLGIDIAAELVAAAERKVPDFLRRDDLALFPAHHPSSASMTGKSLSDCESDFQTASGVLHSSKWARLSRLSARMLRSPM